MIILVVDDSRTILEGVRERLSRDGFEVRTSFNAAGDASLLCDVDLVILDFHMPALSGTAALKRYRELAALAGSTPDFYLYSADPNEALRSRSYGFSGAFSHKGDFNELARQVSLAARIRVARRTAH